MAFNFFAERVFVWDLYLRTFFGGGYVYKSLYSETLLSVLRKNSLKNNAHQFYLIFNLSKKKCKNDFWVSGADTNNYKSKIFKWI